MSWQCKVSQLWHTALSLFHYLWEGMVWDTCMLLSQLRGTNQLACLFMGHGAPPQYDTFVNMRMHVWHDFQPLMFTINLLRTWCIWSYLEADLFQGDVLILSTHWTAVIATADVFSSCFYQDKWCFLWVFLGWCFRTKKVSKSANWEQTEWQLKELICQECNIFKRPPILWLAGEQHMQY